MQDGTPQHDEDERSLETLMSRPAVTGPFGPLDCECKAAVDAVTLQMFDRKARTAGFSDRSKLLRHLIYLAAHGKSFGRLMAEAEDRRTHLLLSEGLELGAELTRLHVAGEVRA